MDSPFVSIVCEVFNHEPYLRQCLDGFLMQKTRFPFEVLIHDDASTDRSADIIREYEKEYPGLFKPIYQVENQYSKGVKIWASIQFPRARGKYIALCEGDDYWTDPLKLQCQVDYLERHPQCSLCFHKVRIKADHQEQLTFFSHLQEREYSAREIYETWTIPTCSVVFRAFDCRMDKRVVFGDTYLWLLLSERGTLNCLNITAGVYRRHRGSATDRYNLSIYPRLATQYRFMGKRFPQLRDISLHKEEDALKVVIRMPYFDGLWKYRFRYMWLHPRLFFSSFFTTTLLSYTPIRHH